MTAPLPIIIWQDPDYQSELRRKVEARIVKHGDEGCWTWTGPRYHAGHGYCYLKPSYDEGRNVMVHRLMWLWEHGDTAMILDHMCGDTTCVNPRHLQPVSPQTNVLRGNGPSALNAQMDHCKQGHPLYGDNLYVGPDGHRRCYACILRRSREHKDRENYGHDGKGTRKYRSASSGKKTHCVNGHEWIPENVLYRKSGRGECRVCHRLRERARQRRLREATVD